MPPERVNEIVEYRGLPAITENTITDPDGLRAELGTIRDRGYAIDNGERLQGLHCVSAPIMEDEEAVLGSISVSAPAHRLDDHQLEEELPKQIQESANVIELGPVPMRAMVQAATTAGGGRRRAGPGGDRRARGRPTGPR